MVDLVSTADLLDLRGIVQRQSWFSFDVLDDTLTKLEEVEPEAFDATITLDTSRTTMRTMDGFTLPPDIGAEFQEIGTYIRPWMHLENDDLFPLGTFRFVDAKRLRSSVGVAFEGTLGDRSTVLDVQTTETYSLNAGVFIEQAIASILIDHGITTFSIDPTGVVIGTPVAYPAGSNWLQIINELAALGGWFPLAFDPLGGAVVQIAPTLTSSMEPDVSYVDGLNIYDDEIAEWNDLLTAPNLFVVIESGATTAPIRGEYALPPTAPNSAFHIGFDNPVVINEQGLASVEAANQRAKVAAITQGTVFEHATFSGAPDPRHKAFTIVGYRDKLYIESQWRMTLSEGAAMSHTLSRVYTL